MFATITDALQKGGHIPDSAGKHARAVGAAPAATLEPEVTTNVDDVVALNNGAGARARDLSDTAQRVATEQELCSKGSVGASKGGAAANEAAAGEGMDGDADMALDDQTLHAAVDAAEQALAHAAEQAEVEAAGLAAVAALAVEAAEAAQLAEAENMEDQALFNACAAVEATLTASLPLPLPLPLPFTRPHRSSSSSSPPAGALLSSASSSAVLTQPHPCPDEPEDRNDSYRQDLTPPSAHASFVRPRSFLKIIK